MVIAVDFDGTVCTNEYPEIGVPRCDVIETLKDLRYKGNILILWTCRCDEHLTAAIEWCRKHGLEFDYINENTDENRRQFGKQARKIFADIYLDDRAITLKEFVNEYSGYTD